VSSRLPGGSAARHPKKRLRRRLSGELIVISTAKFCCITATFSFSFRNVTSYHILTSSVNRRTVTWNLYVMELQASCSLPAGLPPIPVILKMIPVIFKLALGINFPYLFPRVARVSFATVLFIGVPAGQSAVNPPGGDTHRKRTVASVGNFS